MTTVVAGADTSVQVTSAATSVNTVAANENSADALYNQFITLMVAQVQNQDPLNPADGTEYVSQLAQFAQVQSTENMVTILNNNAIMMDNLQVLTTADLVGQTVAVRTDSLKADGETVFDGAIELTSPSNTVTLELTDEQGNVTNIALGSHPSGSLDFSIDTAALGLEGNYSMAVLLDEGQSYAPEITLNGKVEMVSIPSTGGSSVVSINGIGDIPFYEIASFGEKSS